MAAPVEFGSSGVPELADQGGPINRAVEFPYSSTGAHKHGLRRRGSNAHAFVNRDADLLAKKWLGITSLAEIARPAQDVLRCVSPPRARAKGGRRRRLPARVLILTPRLHRERSMLNDVKLGDALKKMAEK